MLQVLKNIILRPKDKAEKSAAIGHIGIDIRHEGINLAQMQRQQDGQVTVHAHASVAADPVNGSLLDSPAALKKLISKAMRSANFKGKKVVAAMDSNHVKLIPLTYSNRQQGAEAAIAKLLKDRVEGEADNYVIDYLPVRSESQEGEQMALVALANRNEVSDFLEVLNQAGLDIEALDIRPAALTRLVETISMASDYETILVITFGENKTFLTIISGRRLLFDQEVQFGEKQLLEQMAAALEMSVEETKDLFYRHGFKASQPNHLATGQGDEFADMLLDIAKPLFMQLIDEISRVIVFIASETRGRPVSNVYLCGSMTSVSGIDKLLADILDMPVKSMYEEYRELFKQSAAKGQQSGQPLPGMVIAAGLALRGML